jgi:hypothetical protein
LKLAPLLPALRARWRALALALTAVTGGLGAEQLLVSRDVVVVVDAEVEGGSTIELFHNELWDSSNRLPIQDGRHLYRFDGLPSRLWSLRLDPTDAPAARVRIFRIILERAGRPVRSLDPETILGWTSANLRKVGSGEEVAEYLSLTADPMLIAPGVFDLETTRDHLLGPVRSGETFPLLVLIAFLVGGFFPWRGWRDATWTVLLPASLLASAWVERFAARLLDRRLGGIPSAAEAVGNAVYLGYPKFSDFNLYFLSVVLAMALGFLAGQGLSRLSPSVPDVEEAGDARLLRWSKGAALVLLLFFALATFPPLAELELGFRQSVHGPRYDLDNVYTWAYLVHRGWRPFRDFWYPYGLFSSFDAGGPFPWGYLLSWAHQLGVVALATWAVMRLSARWPWKGLLLIAMSLGFVLLGIWVASGRYFLALDLALLALVARADGYREPYTLGLAVLGVYAFALEPNQLFYGGLAVAAVIVLDLLRLEAHERRALLHRLLRAVGLFAVGVGLLFLVLSRRDQLQGFLGFLEQLPVMTVYGSLPAHWRAWYRLGAEQNLLLLGPLFLLGLAATLLGWRRRIGPPAASALALGILGAFTFNKFLVRPHIANQTAVYSAVGLLLALFQLGPRLRPVQRALCWGTVAFLVASRLDDAALAAARWRVQVVAAVPASLRTLVRGAQPGLELSAFEDIRRYPVYQPVVERIRATGSEGAIADKVFELGDDSVLYVALRQQTPYYLTLYNASPLEAQQKNLDWVSRERPGWLVWRPGFGDFDGVPNTVRVPLLYGAAVEGFLPVAQLGDLDLLVRRPESAPIDLEYWAAKLGTSLDLHALPAVSGLSALAPCRAEPCVEALRIRVKQPVAGRTRRLTFRVGGRSFELTFVELAGHHQYDLHLDHVWFYGPLRRNGLHPELVGDAGAGAELERVLLAPAPPVLW